METIWSGMMRHATCDLVLTRITGDANGDRFVHCRDNIGSFTALLHRHSSGEEWFYGPGMQAVYMSHFRPV
jgi:hypothetical protein